MSCRPYPNGALPNLVSPSHRFTNEYVNDQTLTTSTWSPAVGKYMVISSTSPSVCPYCGYAATCGTSNGAGFTGRGSTSTNKYLLFNGATDLVGGTRGRVVWQQTNAANNIPVKAGLPYRVSWWARPVYNNMPNAPTYYADINLGSIWLDMGTPNRRSARGPCTDGWTYLYVSPSYVAPAAACATAF